MVFVYFGVAALVLAGALLTAGSLKEYREYSLKDNPLKVLYPLASFIFKAKDRLFGRKEFSKAAADIKKLQVKENADEEIKLFRLKKAATALLICFVFGLAGGLFSLASAQKEVSVLERSSYGQGSKSYSLEVDFRGESETVELEIGAKKYTDEEIAEIFSKAYEPVIKELLGSNESREDVHLPLNLISKYQGISIQWEISDPDVLDYNGDIRYEFSEDEKLLINLLMTFKLDDYSEQYSVPIVLTAGELSERDVLIENIRELIEENNDVHDAEVVLPDNINGEKVSFSEVKQSNKWAFILLGLAAFAAALILPDRMLESRVKKRNDELMLDFTEIVSKLSLLHDAGLSIYKAFERIVSDYEAKGEERFAYQEMKLALEKIKSGANEGESYRQFGQRCGLHQYIKLGNLLQQNLTKGTKGMNELLKQEAADAFEERKRLALKKGEEASTKMLVPMVMMLVVVIAIVAVPAIISISF